MVRKAIGETLYYVLEAYGGVRGGGRRFLEGFLLARR
jgi:hypothetical protein